MKAEALAGVTPASYADVMLMHDIAAARAAQEQLREFYGPGLLALAGVVVATLASGLSLYLPGPAGH